MTQDIRWKQRFSNFDKAFADLGAEVDLRASRPLSRLEEKGLIQSFECTHELAWNLLKDYLAEEAGTTGLLGSKDTTREAFKRGLIKDGETWMDMIRSRTITAQMCDQETARTTAEAICNGYRSCLAALHTSLLGLDRSE